MILDLNKFIKEGRVIWTELETLLDRFENDPHLALTTAEIKRFHYLYQRSSADLAKLMGFSAQQDVRVYLESIVGRAFSLIHDTRRSRKRPRPFRWLFHTFPAAFRRHLTAFWLATAILTAGSLLGAAAMGIDQNAKQALMPFSHLMQDPADRVAKEESAGRDRIAGHKSTFASQLISNNTRVSFLALSLGITWGVGTVLVLFSNGIFLGATVADYVMAGQTKFLIGWLLPHGSVELPAIILASQAGFILAGALIGRGEPVSLKTRFRRVSADLFTIMGGVCLMLLWAGFIEAFLSQYHEPFVSYDLKILFGGLQCTGLVIFLWFSGRGREKNRP
ncbi:MAG: stage II sporulation protein M [Desulfobacterales bacterium]|nr:stage II sporulation protein M [Desulfobacterales bacterium]